MKRQALIIICPGIENTKGYLLGTKKDKDNFIRFLKSSAGGGWYDSEIKYFVNPTRLEVLQFIKSINADYSFIFYSGHGGINTSDKHLYLELKDGDFLAKNLITSSSKDMIILDTCRVYYTPVIQKSLSDQALIAESFVRVENSRVIFEDSIKECDDGLITIYAASENQSASEDPEKGAYFTYSLIEVGKIWNKKYQNNSVLDIYDAFHQSLIYMNQTFSTKQTPQLFGEKRKKWFPFAISNKRILS